MQLVGERTIPDPATATIEQPASFYTAPPTRDTAWRQGIIASLNVAALILSARLILMFAVFGAIALTWLALQKESPIHLAAIGLYAITTVCPLVWLASRP